MHPIPSVHTWTASVADSPPSVRYEDVQKEGLGKLLKQIVRARHRYVKGLC